MLVLVDRKLSAQRTAASIAVDDFIHAIETRSDALISIAELLCGMDSVCGVECEEARLLIDVLTTNPSSPVVQACTRILSCSDLAEVLDSVTVQRDPARNVLLLRIVQHSVCPATIVLLEEFYEAFDDQQLKGLVGEAWLELALEATRKHLLVPAEAICWVSQNVELSDVVHSAVTQLMGEHPQLELARMLFEALPVPECLVPAADRKKGDACSLRRATEYVQMVCDVIERLRAVPDQSGWELECDPQLFVMATTWGDSQLVIAGLRGLLLAGDIAEMRRGWRYFARNATGCWAESFEGRKWSARVLLRIASACYADDDLLGRLELQSVAQVCADVWRWMLEDEVEDTGCVLEMLEAALRTAEAETDLVKVWDETGLTAQLCAMADDGVLIAQRLMEAIGTVVRHAEVAAEPVG
jgi:hypothetical protein